MDVRPLVGTRPTGRRNTVLVYGYVSVQKLPPAAFTDPMWVVIPSHSSEISWRMDHWPAIHGGTLPTRGTPVLCAYDDRGAMWVISWDGAFSPYTPILP